MYILQHSYQFSVSALWQHNTVSFSLCFQDLKPESTWMFSQDVSRPCVRCVQDQEEPSVPMRAWKRLLWKMSMTLWMECRSCRSSACCSLARYSSSSSRARCASGPQEEAAEVHSGPQPLIKLIWDAGLNKQLLHCCSNPSELKHWATPALFRPHCNT